MAPLTQDRNTRARAGERRASPVAESARVFAGAMPMRDANGDVRPGATGTGAVGVGRAQEHVDTTGGGAGAGTVKWRCCVFHFGNDGGDAVAAADIGTVCHIVDDRTVAATDGSGTRSKAGLVDDLDANGVWVRFDEALARVLIRCAMVSPSLARRA